MTLGTLDSPAVFGGCAHMWARAYFTDASTDNALLHQRTLYVGVDGSVGRGVRMCTRCVARCQTTDGKKLLLRAAPRLRPGRWLQRPGVSPRGFLRILGVRGWCSRDGEQRGGGADLSCRADKLPRVFPPLGSASKRPSKDTLIELAEAFVFNDAVFTSTAFAPGQRLWVHDGVFWLVDTGANPGTPFNTFMRKLLCNNFGPGNVNGKLVRDFVDIVTSFVACGPRPVPELMAREFEMMRNSARRMLFLRGGALDLSGEKPVLRRWGGRDSPERSVLFFEDEVLVIECPASVDGFGDHDDLLGVIKSAYSEYWPVILEVTLQTLRAVQHRKTLVIYGPRMSLKTSLFSTFIRMGLTDVHCPVKVDSFIVSQRWSNSSDSTQDKRVAERKFGRSLFRIVDDVDGQNGKAKFSVHLATIRKQQAGADSFTPPGTWATECVATRTLPLFVITTNGPVEELFTVLPREMDQRDKILILDTHGSVLDKDGGHYDEATAKGVWAACHDCALNPSKYSQQLCSLLCWWMSSPPERQGVDALMAACTIDADLARRDAARMGQPAADAPEARIVTLIDFLGAPEDEDDHTFIQVEGRSGIRRKDIYTAAGVDFGKGGKPAEEAADIVNDWMERKFGVKSETLPGGYAGYKGIALSR